MADNKQYITQADKNGVIMISEDVISTIVGRALEEVEGVAGLSGANKKSWNKSIKLTIGENNAVVNAQTHIYQQTGSVDVWPAEINFDYKDNAYGEIIITASTDWTATINDNNG